MSETLTCEKRDVTPGPRAIAIGAFDGVHLGHRVVVRAVVEAAARLGVPSAALTFEPTPRQYFARTEAGSQRLTPDPERVALLCGLGVQQVLVQSFDEELRGMTPERFVKEVLHEQLEARFVAIGASHTFGANRAGNAERMAELGREAGVEVEIVPLVTVDGVTASSTSIRAALLHGDAALAGKLLGRPYSLAGCVRHGQRLGVELGSPTANIEVPPGKLLPAEGVYAAAARPADEEAAMPAAVVVGPAPTLGVHESRVEAHLIDFEGDLYDRELVVGLLARLREIKTFPDRDSLKRQIERDVAEARRIFQEASG